MKHLQQHAGEVPCDVAGKNLKGYPRHDEGEESPGADPSSEAHPAPGTILTREYRGEVHQVTALDRGFEYRGRVFRSLSGIAKAITGTQWNGYLFFGLRKRGKSNGR